MADAKYQKKSEIGFTLLEIILGVLIFTMVIVAVYTTFRTGLAVYRSGIAMKSVYVSVRAITETIRLDLRSVCAIEETYYDVPPPPPQPQTEEPTYGEDTIIIEETMYSRNPYPFSGNTTEISFYTIRTIPVVRQSLLREQIMAVRYYLEENKLYRERAGITALAETAVGEEIADNVEKFRVRYGYVKENKWFWVDTWDSRRDVYRHPREPKDDSEIITRRTVPLRIYPDLLPEAVEITFAISEPDTRRPIVHEYQTIILIPTATASW
ncbi:MAG: type II secretion system protein GspJ [bacterium]|nr:type II secretion system protein GspJ [bacterium]